MRARGKRIDLLTDGFTPQGVAELAYQNRAGINDMIRSIAQSFTAAVAKARADPNYVHKSHNTPLDDSRPRTLLILGELLRGFILDSGAQMSENHAVDLLHAAMPLNCCDFVLLDGPWAERVAKMKLRLARSSMVMPLAKCFSQRNDGVNAFLADLENFDPKAQPPPPRR